MKRTYSSKFGYGGGGPLKRTKSIVPRTTLTVSNAKKINRVLRNIERKHLTFDAQDDVVTFPQGSYTGFYSGMAQGDDDNMRTGRSVHFERMKFTICVTASTVAAPPVVFGNTYQGIVRLMWVWDKQPNSALATAGDIVSSAASGAVSQFNPDGKQRFTILYDQCSVISGCIGDPKMSVIFKGDIKINKQAQYDGTGATIADCASGALLLFGCTTIAGTIAGDPQCQIGTDLSYTDL